MEQSNDIVYGPSIESWKKELDEMSLDKYLVAAVQKRLNDVLFVSILNAEFYVIITAISLTASFSITDLRRNCTKSDEPVKGRCVITDPSRENKTLPLLAKSGYRVNLEKIIDAITEQKLLAKEFLQKSYSLAAELQALGCNKDTIVGIISDNRLEYPIVILATLLTGATLTGYHTEYSLYELQHMFNIVKLTVLFCSVASWNKVKEVIPTNCQIIFFETEDLSHVAPQHLRFSHVIQSTKMPSVVKNEPNQTAFILYSSGTTDLPKGIMLTHKNWVFFMKLLEENKMVIKNDGPMFELLSTYMCHASGLGATLMRIVRDECGILMPKMDRRLFLSMIEKYKIKRAVVLPAMIIFLLKDPAVDEYDLSSLEFLTYGGASIKADMEIALKTKFSLKFIRQIYGLTECTLYTTTTSPTNWKVGSCGSPLPGTQIKIVHTQTGEILGKNQTGEIYLKGPHITKGYYQNEKATAETIDEDGWLHSGDIAYYDDDGDFFIVDRAKELIKCGGSKVFPAELEALLLAHPSIVDAAVIGVPDENGIELPRAYVVKVKGSKITEEEVIQYIAGKALLPYKRLQGGVEFVSEIPRNTAGKILRRKLRELWNE